MPIKTLKSETTTWYYLTDFGSEESSFLKANFKFHPLDLKDCAGEAQRSKIDTYRNYLFLVFQLPTLNAESTRVTIDQLHVFIGKDYIVTVTKEKLKFLQNFFYKLGGNHKLREGIFNQGSGYLLYRMLDHVLRRRWEALDQMDRAIKKIEQDIDEGRGKRAVFEIASLRRVILQFRSVIDPQRMTINTLSRLNANFLKKDMTVYFDDIDDYVEKVWFSLESYRDRILSLHEINESLISYRTNKVMRLLTIFSVALLPLTFITGLYGMNVELPFNGDPTIVWSLFGVVALTIAGIFLILKKKDWI